MLYGIGFAVALIVDERDQNGVASQEAEEERARARRRLRADQDAEYQAALLQDQEREDRRRQKALRAARKKREVEEAAAAAAKKEVALDARRRRKGDVLETEPEPGPDVIRVRIRLPNGELCERTFLNTSTVQVVYDYVDTLMCFDVLSYTLFSSFPRVVYDSGNRDKTLKAAGFDSRVTLFVQIDEDK
uniref:UBX domain-containing protein n=1 Tax=Physcomitrium patens TaxID=3218 RepID=A0A2K1KNT7_PHYPA|nr:hypothetical protein PHYPA_006339 [Physcomitrium patens]